jgi:hypothetical protein
VLARTTTNRTGKNVAAGGQILGGTIGGYEYLQGQMYSVNIFNSELPQSDVTILNKQYSGLLNKLSTPISNSNGCYSLEWININYTGYIIKIRRASDNTTM